MELLGVNSDLSGGSTQLSPLSAASLQANVIAPNSYGLSVQPNSNSQIASIQFDETTGWLAIAGNANNNIVKQTITGNGYYQFDIDGTIFSSDRSSASFWQSLDGATSTNVLGINFDGGLGDDTLIVGSQEHINSFGVIADDTLKIQGEVHSKSLFFKAKDIINQGSIMASNITAEFSNSYTDKAEAKIIASNGGNILLNGGKTGDLEATGQFLATGVTGGKIDFRGKTVNLRGANLDASGKNGGGTILIGGDYQGVDPTGLGTLSNAQFNFVDKFSSINANAVTRGNGGKVIIWSDVDTDFRGNITARGGLKSGDGGFVEVSGKQILNFVGNVDVGAAKGKQGSILLDPTDLIIGPDDGNDETFDISDLVKAGGHLLLDATNDIIFNTEVNFLPIPFDALPTEENAGSPIPSSLTLIAGNSVIFREDINTFGRDLKITASFIKADGRIRTNDSLSPTGGGYIELVSRGGIDIKDISTSNGFSQGNSINLEAGTFIAVGRIDTSGFSGGDVRLSANQDITSSDIVTYSTNGSSGNVNIKASIGAKLGSIITYSNGDIGRGGAVTINSEYIFMSSILSSSNGGLGGKVTLKANQDIILGSYISSSSVSGDAGTIQVVSASGSISGQGLSANSKQGNGANISLTANRLITTGLIDAGANGNGNGGNIRLSTFGDILTSTIVTNSNGNGKSGNISLVSSNGNIKTTNDSLATDARYIFAGANGGNAGSVTLKAFGDIESGSIITSSQYGEGGNINIEAGGESIKIVNSLSQNGTEYSIYSAGATKNGRITINRKSGATGTFFAVGDDTYNGTKGAIGAGKDVNGKDNSLLATTIVTGTYVDGNIRILTPDIPASSLSNPRTIPAESPTTTYSFAPVSSLNVQGFIDARQYVKAIVALDNLRTIEFYQSQGNTSPTVPQLNSVNQIKTFLNAGDLAAGTKSAMIYTFLSGTTQDNPSGTSLNLFAVTSTSDVIYRTIPLSNGQYLGLTVELTAIDFRSYLQDSSSEDYKDPASRLYDLIFRPLKDALSIYQVNNLIFSNDSLFRTIPLAALYDKQTQTTGRHLVEDFSSSVTPSFQVIEKDKYKSLKSANVLKMGATSFGFLKDQIPKSWLPLSGTRVELKNTAQIELQTSPNVRHSPIYLNNQFSKENFQTLISKNDAPIIHLATHGRKNVIVLGTINSSKESDEISALELRQLQGLSNKELLVFSACQTFLSDNFSYGMAGAALVAGVKSAVASYWDVSDDGTVPVMTGFHQQLLGNGLPKTKALQTAQIAVLTSNYDHPRYWASFALAGNFW